MEIQFERTGGLVPRRLQFTATSAALPPEEVEQLRQLVEAAGFFQQSSTVAPASAGADRFRYRVSLEFDGRQHTLEFSDPVPADLVPLVHWLTAAARGRQH
jgi:hypothetical protein